MSTAAKVGVAAAVASSGAGGYVIGNNLVGGGGSSIKESITGRQKRDIHSPITYTVGAALDEAYENGILNNNFNQAKLVKNIPENEEWWTNFYADWFKENKGYPSTLFASVTAGYSATPITEAGKQQTALNQACELAYRKGYLELKNSYNKLLKDISSFCTDSKSSLKLPNEPKVKSFLSEHSQFTSSLHYLGKVGGHTKNKYRLVNPEKEKDWWEWTYDNVFIKQKTEEKEKLGGLFGLVTMSFSPTETYTHALNQACNSTYKLPYENLDVVIKDSIRLIDLVKKFCIPTNKQSEGLQNPEK